jgi:LysR family cys regulon transcriptional activator
MKTYVECGLGIAIVASLAYDPLRDKALRGIDISHLLSPATVNVWLRRGSYMRSYIYDFMELVSPALTRNAVDQALRA